MRRQNILSPHLALRQKPIAEHRFYVVETNEWSLYLSAGKWIDAGDLQVGDDVRRADGSTGEVRSMQVVAQSQRMYNLTVDQAHTFFVGQGQWLVHNAGCSFLSKTGDDVFKVLSNNQTLTTDEGLQAGIAFLGEGYKELDAGVFVSADNTRMFRMTDTDILGKHGGGPHFNFEMVKAEKQWDGTLSYKSTANKHIYLSD